VLVLLNSQLKKQAFIIRSPNVRWVRLLWNDGYLHKNQRIVLHKAGIRGLPVVGMTVGTHYLVHKEAPDELSIPHQPDAG
jgi:hypothetical protein